MMHYAIFTIGSRGDVQPYIALSRGLQDRGHEVTLASHPSMQALVEAHSVPFAPIGPDVDVGEVAATIRGRSRNWLLGFVRVMQFTVSTIEQASPDILPLCREVDVVIVSHSFAGAAEADKLGKPTVSVTLQHQAIPTPDPSQPALPRVMRAVAGQLMGMMMVRPYNRLRRAIGAPKATDVEAMMSSQLNLLPISPSVVPRDPRWGPQHRMTGYWFLNEPGDWRPPTELRAFLETSEPPVAITLGAMSLGSGEDASETVELILDAVRAAGVRAIVQGWDGVISAVDLPPTVHHVGPVPHSWLFDRVSCVVHHGGFGTTAAVLRAGVPAVVIPHIIDQLFWGERVETLGVGPAAIPRAKLTVDGLADALTEATRHSRMCARAAELGAQIRAETGIETAVRLIENTVGPGRGQDRPAQGGEYDA
jgi:UDP:flavonoid glycosyltransferase YjiC (YdhE family)